MEPTICFFQASRLDPLSSVVAARLEDEARILRLDDHHREWRSAGEPPPWTEVIEALFGAESVQSW